MLILVNSILTIPQISLIIAEDNTPVVFSRYCYYPLPTFPHSERLLLMVRTLGAPLTTALASQTRIPALTLTAEDHVLHYATYQTPGLADAWNDACLASDNSLVRVQVTRGGSGFTSNFQVQRVTDPTQAAQWSTWTTLPGASGLIFQDGSCEIANSSGTLRAFAQRGTSGNTLWSWTSTDNGGTWSGPVSVATPPGGALLKGIASSGNNDVFFLYDVLGGEAMGCSFSSGGRVARVCSSWVRWASTSERFAPPSLN